MNQGVKIVGVGHGVPKHVVDNYAFEKIIDTSDEWIRQRTGVKQRHIITSESVTTLATDACNEALSMAGVDKNEVDLIIGSTITNDTITPSMASNLQRELNIERAMAMDISAGCSGFVYALATAQSLMRTMGYRTAIVVAAEALSRIVDWTDRGTCILFGDGAGAVVLKADGTEHLHFPYLFAKPDSESVLYAKNKSIDTPFYENENDKDAFKLRMKGREVFAFANDAIIETLDALKVKCGDRPFEKIVLHQANYRMADYVSRKTDYDAEQFFLNVDQYANTSSVSIPLALWDAKERGWLKKGDRVALVGFGAGLTWAGIVVDWTL